MQFQVATLLFGVLLTACIADARREGSDATSEVDDTATDVAVETGVEDGVVSSDTGDEADTVEPPDTRVPADTVEPPDTRVTPDTVEPPDTTVTPDTVEPPDTTVAPDTVDTDDAGDSVATETSARDGFDIAPPNECTKAEECLGPIGPCEAWLCDGGACKTVERTGSCDDGNACTGAGTCSGGTCMSGPALTCESNSPCARPTCDPVAGCGTEVIEGGFCEVPNGALWGSCSDVRMAPPDVCLATGICSDETTGTAVPLPKNLLLGTWFMAAQSALNSTLGTAAAAIEFRSDGTWSGGELQTAGAPVPISTLTPRTWCIDHDGGLALDLAINHFVGQIDAAGETFAASGKLGNEVMIGVRPTGTLASVHGAYAAILTTAETFWPVVWYGTIAMDHGCQSEGAVFSPEAGAAEPFFLVDQRVCLALGDDGIAQLDLATESMDGELGAMNLHGAIGPRGDVLLFVREKSASAVYPGLLVLVRLHSAAEASFQGRTSWVSPFQERLTSVDGVQFRGFPGLFTFEDSALVNGRFGDTFVVGERLVTDAYGNFVMDVRTPVERHLYSGYVSATGSFGIYYEVEAPAQWDATTEVSGAPAAPAFGVMIRRP